VILNFSHNYRPPRTASGIALALTLREIKCHGNIESIKQWVPNGIAKSEMKYGGGGVMRSVGKQEAYRIFYFENFADRNFRGEWWTNGKLISCETRYFKNKLLKLDWNYSAMASVQYTVLQWRRFLRLLLAASVSWILIGYLRIHNFKLLDIVSWCWGIVPEEVFHDKRN
jgi:hypothetical protein